MAIAEFVKKAKKLQELNLYMNDIGNGGAYKVWPASDIGLIVASAFRA